MRPITLLVLPVLALIAAASPARADVAVGQPAPDFTLKDQDGRDVKLSSFAGKKHVVLAFYPQAGTQGCTKEMTCLTRHLRKIEARGAVLLGISVDPQAKLKEWSTALGIRFPLLSDDARTVSKLYGVYVATPEGGRASRSTFVVDKKGNLAWMEKDFAVPATLDGSQLLAELDKIMDPADDPATAFAKLPSPEREAKTLFVRWVEAQNREDAGGIVELMHPEFGWRGNEPQAMWTKRRETELARLRKLFDTSDLRAMTFDDFVDVAKVRAIGKSDLANPVAAGLTDAMRKVLAAMGPDDVLVHATTKAPKTADAEVLPKEVAIVVRKADDGWRLLEVVR